MKKVNMFVAISYYHRKIGPLVFYSYPKISLDKDLSIKIANIMDQQFNEGFSTYSFENLKSMNYYFEIQSDWARGNKEMLMVSTVFNHQILPEIEEKISDLCIEFSERLQSNEEIYTAFYINELNYHKNEKGIILKNETLVKAWLNNLYMAIIEDTREKTEEEKIALLMNDKHIFETLGKTNKSEFKQRIMRWEDTLNVLIALLKRNSEEKAAKSEIRLGFYPKSELIKKAITEFAKKVDSGGVIVIDDISLIIGSYYKDDESRHLLIASIPYFLTLSDNFPSNSVLENIFEDRMIVQRFGKNFIFKQITLNRDSSPYYLLILKDDLVFHKEDFETFAKKLKEILYKIEIMEWKKTFVQLSFFHKVYSYPKQKVGEEISDRLYDVMTQQKGEEFFMNSFEDCKCLNYYFQIKSDWARGSREMVMISIIINHQISPEIEESIASFCKKFVEMMQSNEDIYPGFYINEISNYDEKDKERIKKNEQLIDDWVKELYWEIMEKTKYKSEGQKKK